MERQKKGQLRELNLRAWSGDQGMDIFKTQGSLDSNLKKNTAFIKRLRTAINPSGVPIFLQEIRTLSLHKYLTEIVSACFEGICRLKTPAEFAASAEVVSALHQRFGPADFTSYLGWLIGRGLSTPDRAQLKTLSPELREKEEKERLSRQRVLLRSATDLWLVGVLRSLDDITRPEDAARTGKGNDTGAKSRSASQKAEGAESEPFPLEVLKDLLGHDREHTNLPLVVLFVKTFAWDILGSKSASGRERQTVGENGTVRPSDAVPDSYTSTDEEDVAVQDDTPLAAPELQQRFRNVLTRYFDDVKAHVVRDQKHLIAQGRRNAEAYVKSGEVFEDRQANHDRALKAQDKLIASAQTLADVLGCDMPDLTEKESMTNGFDSGIGLVKTGDYLRGQSDGAGIWEDEEERRFYENIIDLKDRVPGILLEEGRKKKTDGDDTPTKKADDTTEQERPLEKPAANDDASTAIANKTIGAQVDALLLRLLEVATKDQVDELAIDFCFLNSKASRNRLLKAMQDIPKGRTDLLPLYARLTATLGKYLKDVSQGMIDYLDDEFRSLQRRKSKDFLGQVRMINIRFIAELTKFGVVPVHIIFHCLKVSLDDFSRMNIEIIASLLENCGRYLLRNADTSPRMASFLETLQRKKAAHHLGQQERMLVENAVYYVNPPERAAIQQKERTTLDLYIRKLIYIDLNKKSLERVTKQIRKLHWEEAEVVEYLRKIFIKPGKIKFSNVYLLAVILGALYRHHTEFAISVLDEILERVTVGLETNEFRYNQRRIAEVKYLGELYIYRMVDSTLIFETLFKLLNHGHQPYPEPGKLCPIDLPDDYFRVRLVCSLLETCGMYFEKGNARKKLDFFLTYLQYYMNVKDPLPMDVEFVVQDTFNLLRPNWKPVLNDLSEAGKLFASAVKQNAADLHSNRNSVTEEPEVDLDELNMEDQLSDDAAADQDDDADVESGEEAAAEPADEVDANNSDDDEQIIVTRPEELRDPEAEADFDRELAKLMTESVEIRKFDRKPAFDIPLPIRHTLRNPTAAPADDSDEEPRAQSPDDDNKMKFSLLSKRGNRQQTRPIELPSDSSFAVAARTQQEAEKAEQQRIKRLVLNYDLTDDQDNGEQHSFHYATSPRSQRLRLVSRVGQFNKSLSKPSSGHIQQMTKDVKGLDSGWKSTLVDSGHISPTQDTLLPDTNTSLPRTLADSIKAIDAMHGQPQLDKSGNSRSKQRARKLQLGDIDWT